MTQNILGDAWFDLPTDDRGSNLHQAIACYEAALRVYTEQNFPRSTRKSGESPDCTRSDRTRSTIDNQRTRSLLLSPLRRTMARPPSSCSRRYPIRPFGH